MIGILWLLAIPLSAQPSWVSVATPSAAYQYFRYWGDGAAAHAVEHNKFDAGNPHPRGPARPYTYTFFHGPIAPRKVCALEDRPGVYWYTPQGVRLGGTFPTSNPTEFNVSALQTGMRGFGVTARFAGDAGKTGAVEVAYFTDRACSDGGVEYGFSRDLATGSILVYWSTFANCGNDANGVCRKTGDAAAGAGFRNIEQENDGTTHEHGFRIYGLSAEAEYTYKILTGGGVFHVQVSQRGKVVQCSDAPNAPLAACSFTKTPGAWFPIGHITSGYIVTGTQTAGDPGIGKGAFTVSDILVAR